MKKIVPTAAMTSLLMACTTTGTARVPFAGIGRYNDIDSISVPVSGGRIVTGESCGSDLFFAIPVSTRPSIEEALSSALATVPGANALANVTAEDHSPLITFFYNRHCFRVSGKAVKLK